MSFSLLPWIIAICVIAMVLFAFVLIFLPIIKPKSGSSIDNAMVRSRSVLIDREKFGAGEVLRRDMQGSDKCSFRVRLESGGELQTGAYERAEIEPFDVFQAVCDPLPPVFITRYSKAKDQNKTRETELMDKLADLNKKIDEWEGKYKKLAADIDHEVEVRVQAQVELAKATKPMKSSYGGQR